MNKNSIHRIFAYLNDKLSNKERHAFEKEANADPFLQDAMDGFAKFNASDIENDLQILNSKIDSKSKKTKTFRFSPFIKIAAGIVILFSLTSLIYTITIRQVGQKQLAEQTLEEKPAQTYDTIFKTEPQTPKPAVLVLKEENTQNKATNTEPIIEKTEKRDLAINFEDDNEIITDDAIADLDKSNRQIIKDKGELKIEKPKSVESDVNSEQLIALDSKTIQHEPEPEPENKIDIKPAKSPLSIERSSTSIVKASIITGTIHDNNRTPIPGASIINMVSGETTITDINGNFTINARLNDNLEVSFIGYLTEQITVNNISEPIKLSLQEDLLALEEVVIISQKKKPISQTTGAVSKIESSDISGIPTGNNNEPNVYKAWAVKFNYIKKFEIQASPIIGWKDYKKYIKKNFAYTSDSSTQVVITLTIDTEGNIKERNVLEAPSKAFEVQIIHLIENGSAWNPAKNNDQTVEQEITLTIKF